MKFFGGQFFAGGFLGAAATQAVEAGGGMRMFIADRSGPRKRRKPLNRLLLLLG
jgi:hypothetical protein